MSRLCGWCNGTRKNNAAYGKVPCPDCDSTGFLDDCVECGITLPAPMIDAYGKCEDCRLKEKENDE